MQTNPILGKRRRTNRVSALLMFFYFKKPIAYFIHLPIGSTDDLRKLPMLEA